MRAAVLVLALAGCASPAGSYSVTYERTSGDCPETREAVVWTVTDRDTVRFPGLPGECPMRGRCEIRVQGTSRLATSDLDVTADGETLSGTTVDFVPPGTSTYPQGCSGSTRVTGRRL